MSALLLWVGVGVLGGVGAVGRFLVDAAVSARADDRFPTGTFVVNLTGAFVLGILTGAALKGDAMLLAGTAVIGSYTTFSTWMFESHRLAEGDQRLFTAVNVGASLVIGVLAAALGRLLAGG